MEKIAIFWHRRDLRIDDNTGLFHALNSGYKVLPIFIFDQNILNHLTDKTDARVTFLHQEIEAIKQQLLEYGSDFEVFYGQPQEVFESLITKYNIAEVYTNHDYEKYGINRDETIRKLLNINSIAFFTFKDQCIFEKDEVLSNSGTPYTVFTPYSRKWKEKLTENDLMHYNNIAFKENFLKVAIVSPNISLEQMGFQKTSIELPQKQTTDKLISEYYDKRNFPAVAGTSRLGLHLRFGTISVRALARKAKPLSETFLNELIWRDFYMNILHSFPHISDNRAFRKEYDRIPWRNNEKEYEAWCQGKTGYPIVDAGMRELNTTGFMHNRVRMIVASFLTKHLLIDWRWGEAYFAQKLLDFDFSANNGGWQWASGSGCDAAPYFRVFSPKLQTEKFDKQLTYIKKWVPEINQSTYPSPIVDHDFARKRVLEVYKKALSEQE